MSEKRPRLNVEIDHVKNYPFIRKELEKDLEKNYPENPEKVEESLEWFDKLHDLEAEMQKIMEVVDQEMLKAEQKSLTLLGSNPERIPYYIQQLSKKYEEWKKQEEQR
ncbi:hypothetical protein I6N96_14490 [Enterococcus sp. BWM-S5]|uniref:Uncharacterized protein n=1 Tax=Enterococcus larvae TaxID=2794352 RepID=A0ABS4CLL8_9ENTE|nr:hypothetical protein [Enterococcus larvae]MBP1047491.1 hypothetical protein [Enterococcus larvae]